MDRDAEGWTDIDLGITYQFIDLTADRADQRKLKLVGGRKRIPPTARPTREVLKVTKLDRTRRIRSSKRCDGETEYPKWWTHDPEDEIFTGNYENDMIHRNGWVLQYIWTVELKQKGLVWRFIRSGLFPAYRNVRTRIERALRDRQKNLHQKPSGFMRACLKPDMPWLFSPQ
jgi:hypothetical protein